MEKQRAEEENKKGSEFTNKGLAMLVFGERKKSRANEQCTQEANAEDETGALTEQVPAQGSTTQPPLMYPFDTVNRYVAVLDNQAYVTALGSVIFRTVCMS